MDSYLRLKETEDMTRNWHIMWLKRKRILAGLFCANIDNILLDIDLDIQMNIIFSR